MITKRGVGFVLAAIAVFFIASSTRVGWAHIADAVLWGVVLLSALAPWAAILGLKATRVLKAGARGGLDGPAVGDDAVIELSVANRMPIPRFLVTASAPISSNGQRLKSHRAVFSVVEARLEALSERKFPMMNRGVLEFGDITLESSAPFGLFRKRKSFRREDRVLVYPRWYAMSSFALHAGQSWEESIQGRSRAGIEMAGSRRYVYGDARRQVHWRNSARTGHLMVKEFDAQQGKPFAFVFITSESPGQNEAARIEDAISFAASVARPLLAQGRHVFLAGSGGLSPAYLSWSAIMARLAVVRCEELAGGDHALEQLGVDTHVLALITDPAPIGQHTLKSLGRIAAFATAVVFGEAGDGTSAMAAIESVGVRTISCRPGEIGAVVKTLESPTGPRFRPEAHTKQTAVGE